MQPLLLEVAVLACPVGMVLMMWIMMRGQGKDTAASQDHGSQQEVQALRAEIEQAHRPSAPTTALPAGNDARLAGRLHRGRRDHRDYFSCVRPHLSWRGCAGTGSSVDVDLDARHAAAPRRPGLQLFIGVAAAVAVVAVVGHCEPNLSQPGVSHTPHPLLSSLGGEFTVNAEHAHLVDGLVDGMPRIGDDRRPTAVGHRFGWTWCGHGSGGHQGLG